MCVQFRCWSVDSPFVIVVVVVVVVVVFVVALFVCPCRLELSLGLLGGRLVDERLVNVWDNSSTSNSGLDQRIQLLISTNGQLQMPRCDTFHLEILAGVPGQLQHFCCEVFQDGRRVYGSCGSHALTVLHGFL